MAYRFSEKGMKTLQPHETYSERQTRTSSHNGCVLSEDQSRKEERSGDMRQLWICKGTKVVLMTWGVS